MVHQSKLQSYLRDPFWKFSELVPQTHSQAIKLDKQNNNTRWQEAKATKMGRLLEYESFVDREMARNIPSGYKRICSHMKHDVNHDIGRYRT
jgi:hypothetical protein